MALRASLFCGLQPLNKATCCADGYLGARPRPLAAGNALAFAVQALGTPVVLKKLATSITRKILCQEKNDD